MCGTKVLVPGKLTVATSNIQSTAVNSKAKVLVRIQVPKSSKNMKHTAAVLRTVGTIYGILRFFAERFFITFPCALCQIFPRTQNHKKLRIGKKQKTKNNAQETNFL